jgi:ribonuclease HI
MSTESLVYVGFADGASRHTQNLASTAWVIYSPEGLLVSSGGVCLGPSMNNVAEYNTIIELLRDAISHGILSIEVHLDSQLVVCQLNGCYHVRDLTLLRRFLRVHLLE